MPTNMDERLRAVFSDVFGIDKVEAPEASAETLESWDSVAHLRLILALEGEFHIQFEAEEIPELISFEVVKERTARASEPSQ